MAGEIQMSKDKTLQYDATTLPELIGILAGIEAWAKLENAPVSFSYSDWIRVSAELDGGRISVSIQEHDYPGEPVG